MVTVAAVSTPDVESDGGDPGGSGERDGAELVAAVRIGLREIADPARAPGQQAYMKSAMPYLGATWPDVRAVVRPLLADPALRPPDRGTWRHVIRTLWDDATHREERYAAIEVGRHRRSRSWLDVDALGLCRHLLVTGAWWDLVDATATDMVGEVLRAHRAGATPVIRDWSVADDLWLRRAAIITQLPHRAGTDVDLLAEVIEANLEGSPFGREFFVRKAIGWALRQHARTDPAWVRAFVAAHESGLSPLSRREALKHL
ncbi:MAG: DNA alkylation repair protein [Dermatophilaceae bacterium]